MRPVANFRFSCMAALRRTDDGRPASSGVGAGGVEGSPDNVECKPGNFHSHGAFGQKSFSAQFKTVSNMGWDARSYEEPAPCHAELVTRATSVTPLNVSADEFMRTVSAVSVSSQLPLIPDGGVSATGDGHGDLPRDEQQSPQPVCFPRSPYRIISTKDSWSAVKTQGIIGELSEDPYCDQPPVVRPPVAYNPREWSSVPLSAWIPDFNWYTAICALRK